MALSNATLGDLPATVAVPRYDRAALRPGILHVGVGNFHRAHQAVYLDDLFNLGLGHDYALAGAGVRPGDAAMRERLAAQDYLSSVIALGPDGTDARVVGAMVDFVPVEPDNAALIARLADPVTRIASLTVTEGGYYLDDAGAFDTAHPDVTADAARPDRPGTVFGALIEALRLRRASGTPPFAVMSCDNLPGNGDVAKGTVIGLARLGDPSFADWIAGSVAFPNGMVDRITPATGERERRIAAELGLDDAAPVTCEAFRQWVLEDAFPDGRPPLEEAGVTFASDLHAYELMKLRIVNGGHAIIAYPAELLGIEYAHQAMADPDVDGFLHKVETAEVLPHVAPVPGMTPAAYLALAARRFANPNVLDTTRRLALDGSNRQPKFIVPSVRDGLASGAPVEGLALVSALWCRYCAGTREDGSAVAANDPAWDSLTERAAAARERPAVWLEQRAIYGDLATEARFAAPFAAAVTALWRDGVRPTLKRYLAT